MTDEETGQWLECLADKDYEIWSDYPFPIRRKGSDKVISERVKNDGYIDCYLNRKHWLKHRIIAIQFIPNPNNLSDIDHMNHNRTDNRLTNLRWVNRSENIKNKSSHLGHRYTFLNELPPTAYPLESYNTHRFENLYIDNETQKLYIWNGVSIRELLPYNDKGSIRYITNNTDGKQCSLSHRKLFEEEEDD